MNKGYFVRFLTILVAVGLVIGTLSLGIGLVAAQQGETEPNNSQNAATPIDTSEQVNANLGLGDEDWYSFEVDGPSTVDVDLEDLGVANVELIGPDGNTLETEGPNPRDFAVDVSEGGTYYLQFTTVGSSNGDYSFTVTVSSDAGSTPSDDGSSDSGADESGTDDEWPDSCSDAPVLESGTYTGVLDVPADRDAFRIKLARGERMTISARVADGHSEFYLWESGVSSSDIRASASDDPDVTVSTGIFIGPTSNGGPGNWLEILANEGQFFCYQARENSYREASFPYEWEVTLTRGNGNLSRLGSGASQEEIAELRTTIEKQRQRIERLEQQLNAESGGQAVTINVEVTPAATQNRFVTGGKALVKVSTENADLSQLQVHYGDGTYTVGQDGRVEIPLVDTGQHEMQFSYGETTESVSITVQQASSSHDDSSVAVPGFGILAAILAMIGAAALLHRAA